MSDQTQTRPGAVVEEPEVQAGPPGRGASSSDETLPPARLPRGSARAGWLGLLLAIILLALGLLAAHDGIALLGWVESDPVALPVAETEVGVRPDTATTVLGVVLALLGLWLLWSALKRSPRRGARLATATGVWMTFGDLRQLVTGTAEDVHGVLAARAAVSRRRVRVDVRATSPEVREHVQQAVTERLSALREPPRVTVVAAAPREGGGGR